MFSKICNAIVTVMLIAIILVAGALTVPKWLGMEIYGVLSGSMEPAYPVGSVLYVADVDANEIQVGDPISFYLGNSETVATHRVIGIDKTAQTFSTKGDNNPAADGGAVSFQNLIGKPVLCIPMLGTLAAYIETDQGKLWCGVIVGFVIVLWILAALTEKKENKNKKKKAEDDGKHSEADIASPIPEQVETSPEEQLEGKAGDES